MLERRNKGFRPPIEVVSKNSVSSKRRPDQPYLDKAKTDSLRSVIEKIKRYSDRDFKNVLYKMLKEKKGLNEACRGAGMPHFRAVSKYAKKNVEYRKQLEKTYEQLLRVNSLRAEFSSSKTHIFFGQAPYPLHNTL